MKLLILFIIFSCIGFASKLETHNWPIGDSLLTFFEKNNISQDVYFNLSRTDQELCSEIKAGTQYDVLVENNVTLQILIPISEEIQIHIVKNDNSHSLNILPIESNTITQTIVIDLHASPYQDILDLTNNQQLANEFLITFKDTAPFRRMRKNDTIVINYSQKIRLGKFFGSPTIISAMVKIKNKKYLIYKNNDDGRYYNEDGKSLTNLLFKLPLKYKRISSRFTKKRWHPILKKYSAHLGIDYAAPTGRRIYASAGGRIIHRGKKGGYGKTIIIAHKNGFRTLYAHMNKYSNKYKIGSYVKQGSHIGYVGSTGMSTGPHLHFGLYKNGRAMNPHKIVTIAVAKLKSKEKKSFLKTVAIQNDILNNAILENQKPLKLYSFNNFYTVEG